MGRRTITVNKYVDAFLMTLLAIELVLVVDIFRKEENDLLWILLGLIGVVAVSVQVTKFVFWVGGRRFSHTFLKHLGDPLKKPLTMKKWCDQSWQLVIHASMTYFEYVVLKDETWWQDTTTLWNQGSVDGVFPEQKMRTKLLYMTQLAIWIYTALSCKFLEEIRKDYIVMMSHHIVTIALVTWSYAVGFLPVGVIVLLLHDVSDVPLDLLKMANYLKLEGVKGLFVTETLYVIVLGTWIYMRIYLYPSKLLYTTLFENREATMAASVAHDFTILFPNPGPPYWLIFNIWMIALYCLHIWWGFLLLRILIRISSSSVHDAGKDEYEGSSESSESEKED